MTYPAREYNWVFGETVKVRDAANGARIVVSSRGWIVRVDDPPRSQNPDWHTIARARQILRWRLASKTLPHPWGRVIKYEKQKRGDTGGREWR